MISIIIPAYNEEKAIEKTVRQFKELKVPHEVIVADSKSTDKTVPIAKQCADQVIEMPADQVRGVSNARNNGGKAAQGEFIVFLDCDDTIPDLNAFFDKCLLLFAEKKGLLGLSCRIEVEPHMRTTSDWLIFGGMNLWFVLLNNILKSGIAAGKFIMVRREAFNAIGGFNSKLPAGEDVDFFNRLQKKGPTYITWALVVYHSGRRFHQLGAWTTLYRWIKNAFSVWIFKKSADDGWTPVR